MTTYVLIPGAGGTAWYWHRLVPELQQRGHEVVAVDLPADDDSAGLREYADAVIDAVGYRTQLILVAQSLAGFTAPLVCERRPVDLLGMLNAMVPAPGETPGDWWANTGHGAARAEQAARDGRTLEDDPDLLDAFFHDFPPQLTAEAMAHGVRRQSYTPFTAWPRVPTSSSKVATTASFPWSSSVGSFGTAWASHPMRCQAGTSSLSADPKSSQAAWRRTGLRFRSRTTPLPVANASRRTRGGRSSLAHRALYHLQGQRITPPITP
jgi:hypothetical protein